VLRRQVSWGRWIFYAVVALLALWLAWAARGIWFPVAIAVVIAIVLDPSVDRLENRGVPRGWATALVFLIFIGGAALAIFLLSPGISAQASQIARDLGQVFPDPDRPDLVPVTRKILARLDAHPALRDALIPAARTGTGHLQAMLQQASVLALAWAPNLIWFLVVPVLAFYILNDFHRVYAKIVLLVPRHHRPFAQTLIAEISALFGKYLRGLAFLCFALGCSIALLLYLMGNPYWQLLGLLGGLAYAIPVVGSLVVLVLVVLVSLITGSAAEALWAGGGLVLLTNGIFDQVITPRVLGRQVGLHPVLTILALLIGYQVWGVVGMLVAVPLAACVQTVVVHLVPKLGVDMELRPLEELEACEDETREAHLEAEAHPLDEHFRLQSVVENVESPSPEEEGGPAAGAMPPTPQPG
jgi:predicted PurR-regulated permease PerM